MPGIWPEVSLSGALAGGYKVELLDRGTDRVAALVADLGNGASVADGATLAGELVVPADSSAAEEIAKVAPPGVPVMKAFNTTFASGHPRIDGVYFRRCRSTRAKRLPQAGR